MIFKTTKGLSYKTLKLKFPEYHDEIFRYVTIDDLPISERIWLFQNGLYEIPKCECESCNNNVEFIKFYKGYRKYCSRTCAAIDTHKNIDVKKSRIVNMLSCNYDTDKRVEMTRKSNITKSKFTEEKNNTINNKREITNLQKWGVDNISKNSEIKKKISEKLKIILPDIRANKTIKCINDLGFEINKIDSDSYNLKCPKCSEDFEISRALFGQRKRFDISICLVCNPNNNNSDFESKVYEYIRDNFDGEVLSGFRKFEKYEIDIYIPELKVGFECNGLWWHSEKYKENDYHQKKTDFFLDKGIRIIHIWEDDWKYKKDIVCSRISNIINKSKCIYARNCDIRELSSIDLSKFLTDNHIQGKVNSKIKIGLYYNDELVSAISFGSLRKNLGRNGLENNYELLRFCNKINTSVVGGASKLFKYFINKYSPEEVISYASRDWSLGDLYTKLGFSYIKKTSINYFYFHKDIGMRMNRYNYRKDRLVDLGYDKELSEHKIMIKRGYYRIYDTGSYLYSYKTTN